MAVKIGITGGIGSGKSLVAHLLEVMGVPVYVSDVESKRLVVADARIRKELAGLLGAGVYDREGRLDKALLAAYLFASAGHARRVNAIIHPRVKDDFRRWARSRESLPVVGIESAILLEAGFMDEVDKVVTVYAPQEVRIARAMKRDGASREQVLQRIRSQMDDDEKRRRSDFVILNDGTTPLIPQVAQLLSSCRGG